MPVGEPVQLAVEAVAEPLDLNGEPEVVEVALVQPLDDLSQFARRCTRLRMRSTSVSGSTSFPLPGLWRQKCRCVAAARGRMA